MACLGQLSQTPVWDNCLGQLFGTIALGGCSGQLHVPVSGQYTKNAYILLARGAGTRKNAYPTPHPAYRDPAHRRCKMQFVVVVVVVVVLAILT